ncbi:DUF1338 domain-containing protein [Chitinophaga sp. ARDCPP14]|uniref:DUF1338 domain-containing protein n=1 Tax=Chitinophaga sp. ARDCPP14 TaxID=3391139 RepID=UPI003F52540B
MSNLQLILDGLMRRYKERVPDVEKVISAMMEEGLIQHANEIENDHIAFRTIGVPHLGIQSLEKIFLHHGYVKRDYYYFAEKKLDAYWYAPPAPSLPRIFISELRVKDLSPEAQHIIHHYTDEVTADPVLQLDLNDAAAVDDFLHSGLWRLPVYSDFSTLAKESEYASWTIYNRYYLNHFTISVHNLKLGYNDITAFNRFLEQHGFVLNDAGGKFKESPDGLLLQSSTVAGMITAAFADGEKHAISGSYVEFAERRVLPAFRHLDAAAIKREHRREGFEAANANKIFESTYSSQTNKK